MFFTIEPSKPVITIPGKPTTIEAQDRSPITMTIGDNVTALTDTNITIQCRASGIPTPAVTWTKDGQKLSGDGSYTVRDGGSLVINRADEQDAARYTCTANSIAGKDSASSTVQIVGKKIRGSFLRCVIVALLRSHYRRFPQFVLWLIALFYIYFNYHEFLLFNYILSKKILS